MNKLIQANGNTLVNPFTKDYWLMERSPNNMGELLELQNYLASVRDDLKKHNHNSFANNITTAIGILMDYRMSKYHLTKYPMTKLIAHSGTLNLLLNCANRIENIIGRYISKKLPIPDDKNLIDKELADIAFEIGELVMNSPIHNDLEFFKTIYNRHSYPIININKQGVIGHASNCNCAYCNKRKEK
jgi:hypothetical protein